MENVAADHPKVTPEIFRGPADQLKAVLGEDVWFHADDRVLDPGGPCAFCGKELPPDRPCTLSSKVGGPHFSIWEDTGKAYVISVEEPRCGRCIREHGWGWFWFSIPLLAGWILGMSLLAHWHHKVGVGRPIGALETIVSWGVVFLGTGVAMAILSVNEKRKEKKKRMRSPESDRGTPIIERLVEDGWTPGDKPPKELRPVQKKPEPPQKLPEAPAAEAAPKGDSADDSLISDRYRLEVELGRGGFGIVYRARDERMESRPVVVKVLLDRSKGDKWLERKFKDEMRALVRLNHPGVVGALDYGVCADGRAFLVMEFVPGQTLRGRMNAGAMTFEEIADIVRQMGRALTAAHEHGIYHRDLKPENVMLQDLGHGQIFAKIIDFGIATVKESEDSSTKMTMVAGTPYYMAPEQLAGRPTAASDIWALGVIAYEMVTGQVPFRPDSPYELLGLQREGAVERPISLRPGLPLGCDPVILRALSFKAEDRPASARELAESLAVELTRAAGEHHR